MSIDDNIIIYTYIEHTRPHTWTMTNAECRRSHWITVTSNFGPISQPNVMMTWRIHSQLGCYPCQLIIWLHKKLQKIPSCHVRKTVRICSVRFASLKFTVGITRDVIVCIVLASALISLESTFEWIKKNANVNVVVTRGYEVRGMTHANRPYNVIRYGISWELARGRAFLCVLPKQTGAASHFQFLPQHPTSIIFYNNDGMCHTRFTADCSFLLRM